MLAAVLCDSATATQHLPSISNALIHVMWIISIDRCSPWYNVCTFTVSFIKLGTLEVSITVSILHVVKMQTLRIHTDIAICLGVLWCKCIM